MRPRPAFTLATTSDQVATTWNQTWQGLRRRRRTKRKAQYDRYRPDEGGSFLMGDFATGTPELQKASDDMVATNQQLQDAGSQLASSVEAVEGAWKGAAQTAFNNLMQQYFADFKNLNDTLF